jgi:hypothetical protein
MSFGSSDTTSEVSWLMGTKPGRHKGNGDAQIVYFDTSCWRFSPSDIYESFIIRGRPSQRLMASRVIQYST